MQNKITSTTSANSFGSPPGKKVFKIPSGEYANRMIVILKTSDSEIKFATADKPYNQWSSLTSIVSDSAVAPFDAVIDSAGNVHVVYIEQTTGYLVAVKLSYSAGNWMVGSKVYIYNGAQTNYPSIDVDASDYLWVAYIKSNGGNFDLYIKSSTDSGTSWTNGESSDGDLLKATATNIAPKVLSTSKYLYVVYSVDWIDIMLRSKAVNSSTWRSEYTIASGSNIDENFDSAATVEGLLGVAFDDNAIKYREFDGSNWGSVITVDAAGGEFPQLVFQNNIPIIYYLSAFNSDQIEIKYSHRATGLFSTPQSLLSNASPFDKLILYNAVSATYEDLTTSASDATAADILHTQNSKLLNEAGDIAYLGLADKFRFVKLILSTAGSGGVVSYSYWDGSNWVAFVPSGGAYNLISTDYDLTLWDDLASIPLDWQKTVVKSSNLFWVKIDVASSYTTAPIGTQITAINDIEAINIGR